MSLSSVCEAVRRSARADVRAHRVRALCEQAGARADEGQPLRLSRVRRALRSLHWHRRAVPKVVHRLCMLQT